MRLDGSCHCGGVRFRVESHTPYPFMRCYCSICRKTQGGGGYAINIMGEADTLEVRGERWRQRLSRATRRAGKEAQVAVAGAQAFLQPLRERVMGVRSALAAVGLPVRVGHRHAAAQAAGGRRAHAELRGAVGGRAARDAVTRTSASIRAKASPTGMHAAADDRLVRARRDVADGWHGSTLLVGDADTGSRTGMRLPTRYSFSSIGLRAAWLLSTEFVAHAPRQSAARRRRARFIADRT